MSQVVNVNETVTLIPSGYDSANSSYSSISSSYPVTNGYTNTSSTSYAYITCRTGSRASTYISYTFDTSDIPSSATIDSITAKAKLRVSSTSYISTAVVQLYSGSTAKGSSTSARTTTATTYTISSPGTWTRAELDNLEIRYTGTRGTSNTSRAAYLYFYGAEVEVTYSVSGTQYTLTAVSEVTGATIEPLAVNLMGGESQEFIIDLGSNDIGNVTLTDNNVDVTSSMVQHTVSGGTVSRYPDSYTTGGSINGTNYQNTIGKGSDTSNRTGNDYFSTTQGASGSTYIDYAFDFSDLPETAIISSMSVTVKGHAEDPTQSREIANVQLYSGSTAKGTSIDFTSTTDAVHTMSPGTWTREELEDAKMRFTIGVYGGLLSGATWTVTYTVSNSTYYTYTLTNLDDDHDIVLSTAGAFIPPEEDPNYVYYPITISSINATTDPHTGTNRVKAGTNQTITISPTESQVTLILDNGVDVSSQLQGGQPDCTYAVNSVSDASYGFTLNSSTGYYVSQNAGHANSAAVCRVNLDLECECLVTFTYINYAEATYDYGIFGNVDSALSTSYSVDSNVKLACSTSAYNTSSPQTLSYNVSSGTHFIDVKYRKDTATDSNNDNLQFKVEITPLESGDYTYTLTNIQQKHSLIFIFGDVEYYFITSSGNGCKLFPDGQVVKLVGQSYQLVIVPNNSSATVTLTDNGTNVTSQLSYEEGQDKSGNTVVNYNYALSDISAAHNLVVTCISGSAVIYIKENGTWTPYTNVYKKVNGSWVLQSDISQVFESGTNYVKSR